MAIYNKKDSEKTVFKPCLRVNARVNTGKMKKRRWLHLIYGIRVSYFWSGNHYSIRVSTIFLPLGFLLTISFGWFDCLACSLEDSICYPPVWSLTLVESLTFTREVIFVLCVFLWKSWWVRVKNFWPRSGQVIFFVAWVESGLVSHLWVCKFSPKNSKIFNIFPSGKKKSHKIRVKKYPGLTLIDKNIYCRLKVCLGWFGLGSISRK